MPEQVCYSLKNKNILTFIICRLKVDNTAEGSVEEKYKTWCKE